MTEPDRLSRRSFIQTTSLGMGTGVVAATTGNASSAAMRPDSREGRLPREVWVASICQAGLSATSPSDMIGKILRRMEETVPMQPDVICLPECLHVANQPNRPPLTESAEVPIGSISRPFAEFARRHRCNIICPIFTQEAGRFYNAAVVIDRHGRYVGEYRKINPTEGELKKGITPGPIDPPVFQLDFGTIGVQICFDINWHENWKRLAAKGVEIIFWPSAFAGGEMLNALAWINKVYIVSSTRIQATKIVDVLGDDVVSTGRFGEWICSPINLDVAVVQGYQYMRKLDRARAKYGRRINVKTKHVEAWAALESLAADVSVPKILKEFDIETSRDMLARNTQLQNAKRPKF